jgi:hypothetical protein
VSLVDGMNETETHNVRMVLTPFCYFPIRDPEFYEAMKTLLVKFSLYEELSKTSDIPGRKICPWPKKTYTIHNYFVDIMKIPKLNPNGYFEIVFYFLRNLKIVDGFGIRLEVKTSES